jgi:hypothetical protein
LNLLATQLRESVAPALQATGTDTAVLGAVRHLADLSADAAQELEAWAAELADFCNREARDQAEARLKWEKLAAIPGRTYLDPVVTAEAVQAQAAGCLGRWLGGVDTLSLLREHLYLSVEVDSGRAAVRMQSHVGTIRTCESAAEAAAMVGRYARELAELVPHVNVTGALEALPEHGVTTALGRMDLAERFTMGYDERASLVVIPAVDETPGSPSGVAALEAFEQAIPPPQNRQMSFVRSDDPSAVRRLAVVHPRPTPPPRGRFVETAEQLAEQVRQRFATAHELVVPVFPPALRIALSRPEAFQSFARAYLAGHVIRHQDDVGREQWYFSDRHRFLTYGEDSSLASAAAHYTWYVSDPPGAFAPVGLPGDMAPLQEWQEHGGVPNADTLVLAAISIVENGG